MIVGHISKGFLAGRRLPRAEFSTAFYQLSRYLLVGVSLADALDDVSAGSATRRVQNFWMRVKCSVESGRTLSESLSRENACNDQTVAAIIKAGEANGKLGSACASVNEYLRWHLELRQRIVTLLVYPLFSLCVLFAVAGFLLISVVPSIQGFLLSSGELLEWHTQALLAFSAWAREYFVLGTWVCAGGIVTIYAMSHISAGLRRALDSLLLKLPVLGPALTDLLLSRYAHCCAQLFSSGITLENALCLAEQTVENRALRTELAGVRQKMVGGQTFAHALRQVSVLPAIFTRLVAVGEQTGQLSTVLVQIGEQQRTAAEASISRLEQVIGPVLLLCIGSVLMWIVISMLGPVYNMAIATVVGAA